MPFPKSVLLADRTKVTLLDYRRADRPYIILESSSVAPNSHRTVHVIFPTETSPVKMGRGHQCSIKIDDITVSRVHAELQLFRGKFYLIDLNSKFGTLVKFREEFVLKNQLTLQSGRTLLDFSLLKHDKSVTNSQVRKANSKKCRKET
jgi:hypothetical protein